MARNPKVTVDVEFGKVDQKDIDKIINDVGGKLKKMELDPGWAEKFEEARRKVTEIRKEVDGIKEEQKKSDEQYDKAAREKQKLQQKLNSLRNDADELDRKQLDVQIHAVKLNKELAAIKKSKKKDEATSLRKQQITNDLERMNLDMKQQYEKITNETSDTKSKINQLETEQLTIKQQLSVETDKMKSANDSIVDATKTALGLESQRLALQQVMAKELMKADKSLGEDEALKRAKKMLPLSGKQSKFEQKQFELLKKTKKIRKNELKEKLTELKMHDKMLKRDGVGWWERKKMIRAEQLEAKKSLGGKRKEGGGVGGALVGGAKGELAGLSRVIGSLAGPLLALGSVAGFIMLMLEYNDKIVKARKNLFKLAATGSASFKALEKGQKVTLGQVEAYRSSLRGLYDQVGMTYDEAMAATESLTKAGITLDVTSAGARKSYIKLIADLEGVATITGMSFDEVAGHAGELKTEFRMVEKEIPAAFISIKQAAADAGVESTRFFSATMNAAQGLAIYGTRVEDVAGAFSRLTKGVKMPQKAAMELAGQMVNANETLTSSQKAMIGIVGDAKGMLATLPKLTAEQTKVLNETYPDQLEAQTRYFEALDPGKQIELRFRALAKVAPDIFKDVDISDPKQLAQALSLNREKLAELGKQFGFDKKQLMLVEELAEAGTSVAGIPEKMAQKQKEAEKAALTERVKEQARAIEQGTKSIKDIISEKVAKFVEWIYLWLEREAVPFFRMVADWMQKDYKEAKYLSDAMATKMDELLKEREQMQSDVAVLEKDTSPEGQKALRSKKYELEGLEVRIAKLKKEQEQMKGVRKRAAVPVIGGLLVGGEDTALMEAQAAALWDEKVKAFAAKISSLPAELQAVARELNDEFLADNSLAKLAARDKKGALKKMDLTIASKSGDVAKWYPGAEESAAAMKNLQTFFHQLVSLKSGGYSGAERTVALPTSLLQKSFAGGGYTGNIGIGSAAGVVHGKEFVFDADATKKAGAANLSMLMDSIKSIRTGAGRSISPAAMTAPTAASRVNAAGAAVGGGNGGRSVTNQVTININQRDRQEIEQIVYKVMYDQKGNEV
jgi:hypothetical protein